MNYQLIARVQYHVNVSLMIMLCILFSSCMYGNKDSFFNLNGLVPSGNKPLPEPMYTKIYATMS